MDQTRCTCDENCMRTSHKQFPQWSRWSRTEQCCWEGTGSIYMYVCILIIIDEIFIIVIIIRNRMYVICILINQVSQVFITFLPLYVGGPMWLDAWSYRSLRIWYQYLSIYMNIQLKPPLGRYRHIMCSRGREAIAKLEKKRR